MPSRRTEDEDLILRIKSDNNILGREPIKICT